MAFEGKDSIRDEICVYYKVTEQGTALNMLVLYSIRKVEKKDISEKIGINQVFRPNSVQKHTRITVYKVLARTMLTYFDCM
jgi:hypothetical protein